MGLPSGPDRASIINVHARKIPLLPDIELDEFGLLDEWTGGMTCAEVGVYRSEKGEIIFFHAHTDVDREE